MPALLLMARPALCPSLDLKIICYPPVDRGGKIRLAVTDVRLYIAVQTQGCEDWPNFSLPLSFFFA